MLPFGKAQLTSESTFERRRPSGRRRPTEGKSLPHDWSQPRRCIPRKSGAIPVKTSLPPPYKGQRKKREKLWPTGIQLGGHYDSNENDFKAVTGLELQ